MSELVPTPAGSLVPEALRQMDTAALRAELARSLELTARHLMHLAAVWRELEYRGEDLSDLRGGLWTYMPLIAQGKLRPELAIRYAGHSMLLRRLATMTPEQQDTLLRDATVPLVEYDGDNFAVRRVPVTHLRAAEVAQVIGEHGVRSPEEQRRAALGRFRRAPAARTSGAQRPGAARWDEPPPVVQIAQRLPARLRGRDARRAVLVHLTEDEHAALERAAAEAGVPRARLARAALLHARLLGDRRYDE